MTSITPQLLALWFDAHSAQLFLYARQWLTPPSAEDVIQEVFIRLAAQKSPPENIKAWLLVSVRHAALDTLKIDRRRLDRDKRATLSRAALFEQPNPDAPLIAAEIQQALALLPAAVREVLLLRLWAGATFQEIADITNLPLSSIYHHYRSGLGTLRNKWESPCKT